MFFCFSANGQEKIEKRLALVIGNANYEKGPLENPVNDALLIANTLEQLDFDVMLDTNVATIGEFSDIVRDFGRKREQYDVGFIYYAGHGIQVKSENFLLPTKETFESIYDVQDNGLSVQKIMRYLTGMSDQVNILILDACRDNPFEPTWKATRSLKGGGLAKIPPPTGSLIAFSTDAGQTAADGDGENSVYSTSLARNMLLENTSLDQVFRNVRTEVITATNMNQRPVESSQLTGEAFYLVISDYQDEFEKLYKHFDNEEYFEALEIANQIITKEPNNKRAYRKRADCYSVMNNFDKAAADYFKIINELDSNDINCLHNMGKMYETMRDNNQALEYYNKAIRLGRSQSWVYTSRGIFYLNNKQYDLAMLDFEKALEINSKSAVAYQFKSIVISESGGEYDDAISCINKAIKFAVNDTAKVFYSSVDAISNKDVVLMSIARGDINHAYKKYDNAILEYNELLKNGDLTDKQLSQIYFKIGYTNCTLANYIEALRYLTKSIDLNKMPYIADSYLFRASIYNEIYNDRAKVLNDLNELVSLKLGDYYFNEVAKIYSSMGNHETALIYINKAIELDSIDFRYFINKAKIQFQLMALCESDEERLNTLAYVISNYEKALELNPKEYSAIKMLVTLYSYINEQKKVQELLGNIDAKDKSVYNTKAECYASLGQTDSAKYYFNCLVDSFPNEPSSYESRGKFYLNSGQYQEAKNDYLKAIKLSTELQSYQLFDNLSLSYYYLDQNELAIKYLSKAIDLADPGMSDYNWLINKRANMYKNNLQYEKAIIDYSHLIDIDPKNITAYRQRSSVYIMIKEYTKASADLYRVLELDPDNIVGKISLSEIMFLERDVKENYIEVLDLYNNILLGIDVNILINKYIENGKDPKIFTLDVVKSIINSLYFNRGIVKFELKDFNGSKKDFTEVLEDKNSEYQSKAHRNIITCLKEIDNDSIISDINKFIELDSINTAYYILRAEIFANKFQKYNEGINDLDKAYSLISSSIVLDSNLLYSYNLTRGYLTFNLKVFDEAISNYSNAINLYPKNRSAYYDRIRCYLKVNKFELAEQDCHTTIQLDQEDPEGYYYMSKILLHQNNYLSAINMLTTSMVKLADKGCNGNFYGITSFEGNKITLSDLYYERASIYLELKAYDEMCMDYKKACEIIECEESAPISELEIFNKYCQ